MRDEKWHFKTPSQADRSRQTADLHGIESVSLAASNAIQAISENSNCHRDRVSHDQRRSRPQHCRPRPAPSVFEPTTGASNYFDVANTTAVPAHLHLYLPRFFDATTSWGDGNDSPLTCGRPAFLAGRFGGGSKRLVSGTILLTRDRRLRCRKVNRAIACESNATAIGRVYGREV